MLMVRGLSPRRGTMAPQGGRLAPYPPRPVSPPRCMRAVCLSFFIIMAISMRHHRFAYDVSGVGGAWFAVSAPR